MRRIVGSIETYALPADSFDVIVCHDVLSIWERVLLRPQGD
jgi:hypothetical protein